jgi:sulfur relay (sulfurtransferase) complex TusBCD TusD component (DsrE family)
VKLAIMLGAAPETEGASIAANLAAAALAEGHDVTLFLNADGVGNATVVAPLAAQGAHLIACGLSARQRRALEVDGVRLGSQLDWAEAVRYADRVVSVV